jgi:hypothetical protein
MHTERARASVGDGGVWTHGSGQALARVALGSDGTRHDLPPVAQRRTARGLAVRRRLAQVGERRIQCGERAALRDDGAVDAAATLQSGCAQSVCTSEALVEGGVRRRPAEGERRGKPRGAQRVRVREIAMHGFGSGGGGGGSLCGGGHPASSVRLSKRKWVATPSAIPGMRTTQLDGTPRAAATDAAASASDALGASNSVPSQVMIRIVLRSGAVASAVSPVPSWMPRRHTNDDAEVVGYRSAPPLPPPKDHQGVTTTLRKRPPRGDNPRALRT